MYSVDQTPDHSMRRVTLYLLQYCKYLSTVSVIVRGFLHYIFIDMYKYAKMTSNMRDTFVLKLLVIQEVTGYMGRAAHMLLQFKCW